MGKIRLFMIVSAIIVFAQITNINAQESGRLLTPEEGCGISKVAAPKIIGGEPAKPGAFPWIAVFAYLKDDGQQKFECGGSLITSRHILTAAHCIKPNLIFVRLGEHDLNTTIDGSHQDFKVIRKVGHANYDEKANTNDIAVLTLYSDVEFTDRIRPICLPLNNQFKEKTFVNTNPFVAGWGFTKEFGKLSNVLMQLQLPVVDNYQCEYLYEKKFKFIRRNQFNNGVICAGNLAGGQDVCHGDSGGPLMLPILENDTYHMYQIGLVSYGLGCAQPNVPGVYSRISYFMDWIKKQVNHI